MNTLTIVVLFVCAAAAYASVLPEGEPKAVPAAPVAAEDLLEGAESRYGYGGGGYHRGGHGHGGHGGHYGGHGGHGGHHGGHGGKWGK